MVNIQKYFEEFHDAIRLRSHHDNEIAEKKKILLTKLRGFLERKFEEEGLPIPTFESINQGSYAMDTGILPAKEGDYDIDVGLLFKIAKSDFDPVTVKKWVLEALGDHTSDVQMKEPCVTVNYMDDGEVIYHVDLAVYSNNNLDGQTYLARGEESSDAASKKWELSQPQQLITLITQKFGGDGAQFRRIIKYLKRWKDVNFPATGNGAPLGIGITIAAYNWCEIGKTYDATTGRTIYDDRSALKNFLQRLLGQFTGNRLHVTMPVQPFNDLFAGMSDIQSQNFQQKLKDLLSAIIATEIEPDPAAACEKMQKKFGEDFPVPEKSETATEKKRAIVSSNESA